MIIKTLIKKIKANAYKIKEKLILFANKIFYHFKLISLF